MAGKGWNSPLTAAVCAATLLAVGLGAQQPPAPAAQGQAAGGRGGGRGGMFGGLFTAADADKDGTVTRQEFHATFDKWFTDWSGGSGAVTGAQLADGLNVVFPPPAGGRGGAQNQTPNPNDVAAMTAALPDSASAKPAKPRKVLVLAKARASCTPRFPSRRRPSRRSAPRPARGRRRSPMTRPTSTPTT